ncbi:hypothetical protein D9M72_650380 [compost metagenome]
MIRQIVGHDIGRRQRLAGVHQQGLGIEFGIDDKHGAGLARRRHDLGAGVEVEAFARGCRIGFRRVGCDLEHSETPRIVKRSHHSHATKRRVVAIRRLVDRDARRPARPKAPCA